MLTNKTGKKKLYCWNMGYKSKPALRSTLTLCLLERAYHSNLNFAVLTITVPVFNQ